MATRHHAPYMSGWFHNSNSFNKLLDTIGLGDDTPIACYMTVSLAAGGAETTRMPTEGWVMVVDEQSMALLRDGAVMLHMYADRGGASFWLPVHGERWEMNPGTDEICRAVSRVQLADRYGWLESARLMCVEEDVELT